MKNYIFYLIAYFLAGILNAQNASPSGLILDDLSYNKITQKSFYTGEKFSSLPLKIDLKPHCPIPGNQGEMLSCVGWATGYGAMTIQYAIQKKKTDRGFLTQKAFSAMFIFNQIKKSDCRGGATIEDAMKFLKHSGNCFAEDFDRKIQDCQAMPPSRLKNWARQFAIRDYQILFSRDVQNGGVKISQIKKALANRLPVVVGLEVRQNFYDLRNAEFWWPDNGNQTPMGGHALVVIGYDEKKQAVQCLNSWGTDWGNDGFIWIKYKHFAKFCKYAFVMDFGNNTTQKTAARRPYFPSDASYITSKIRFLFLRKGGRNLDFQPAPVRFENETYKTIQKWNVGQLFQVSVQPPREFPFLYMFSQDVYGNKFLHRKGRLPSNLSKPIVIPNSSKALHLENPGKVYLGILFSKTELTDIETFIRRKAHPKISLKTAIRQFFGNRLSDENAVLYMPNEMGIIVKNPNLHKAIPVTLEVEGH